MQFPASSEAGFFKIGKGLPCLILCSETRGAASTIANDEPGKITSTGPASGKQPEKAFVFAFN